MHPAQGEAQRVVVDDGIGHVEVTITRGDDAAIGYRKDAGERVPVTLHEGSPFNAAVICLYS
jgi:hypothetical protein